MEPDEVEISDDGITWLSIVNKMPALSTFVVQQYAKILKTRRSKMMWHKAQDSDYIVNYEYPPNPHGRWGNGDLNDDIIDYKRMTIKMGNIKEPNTRMFRLKKRDGKILPPIYPKAANLASKQVSEENAAIQEQQKEQKRIKEAQENKQVELRKKCDRLCEYVGQQLAIGLGDNRNTGLDVDWRSVLQEYWEKFSDTTCSTDNNIEKKVFFEEDLYECEFNICHSTRLGAVHNETPSIIVKIHQPSVGPRHFANYFEYKLLTDGIEIDRLIREAANK